MQGPADGIARVEAALKEAVGEKRAGILMHRRSAHLANLTPHQLAREPGGDRIVLAELGNLVIQARRLDARD